MDPGTFSAQGDPTIMSSAGGGGCIIFKNNFSQEHAVEAPFLLNWDFTVLFTTVST